MESGYSSPRADKFPAGLRVLVVDDDPTWLKILEKMLRKCSYEVTTCCLAREALSILRGRKDGFDLVISDVNMPDMDGFKLLEHVGLEMDLPVIMMSVDGETSRVMKGVQHGACDYLLKPIRMKELSNIWQHVLRKKIHESKDTDYYEMGNFQLIQNNSDGFHESQLASGSAFTFKKRKEVENKKFDEQESGDTSSSKKARVVWTVDLHQKFVDAVNQIDFDKIGPKKILDMMKVPGLTRENVASHLQKFRLYLSRLQKENELKASLHGTKTLDFHTETPVSFGFQNSFSMDQTSHESELKAVVSSAPARKIKNTSSNDSPNPKMSNLSTPHIDRSHEIKFKQPSLKPLQKQEMNKPRSLLKVNHLSQLLSGPVPLFENQTVYHHQHIDNFTQVQPKITAGDSAFMPSLEENIQFLLQEYGRGENTGYHQAYDYNVEQVDDLQNEFYGESSSVYWDKVRDLIESAFVEQDVYSLIS